MSSAKLKILERQLGLVPKPEFRPMSPGMERIARQQDRQAPGPVPDHGLGATIESAVQTTVEQTVGQRIQEALAEQRQDFMAQLNKQPRQLPPVTKPKPAFTTIYHRDATGKFLWSETIADGTGEKFIIEITGRNGDGSIRSTRTIPPHEAKDYKPGTPGRLPALPHDDDPRQYRDGEPR